MQAQTANYDWAKLGVAPCEMLLPAPGVDLMKWAVVACDQFTSKRSYWEEADAFVGESPSTLRLMLPEVYLEGEDEAQRIAAIHDSMKRYLEAGVLRPTQRGAILVRRTVGGKTRLGLVLALDLEHYDYTKGSRSLIRATEGTIEERIPPRMRIRRNATLELPHILVLIDDPNRSVIEPLAAQPGFAAVYDAELMQGGGSIEGRFIPEAALGGVYGALEALAREADGKYRQSDSLLFAMGDGNHSLATAKACWESIKKDLTTGQAARHPARFALCEIENVHDGGIAFEPIHRIVYGPKGAQSRDMLFAIESILRSQNGDAFSISPQDAEILRSQGAHVLPFVAGGGSGALCVPKSRQQLEVGTLQSALDVLAAQSPLTRIDYVHGGEIVREKGGEAGNIGFFLPPMKKEDLFRTVVLDGALPRKTFSMGEANEKRYYMECRRIADG